MSAAKHNDELFAQASRPAASFGTILLFLITFVMLVGGFYLFGISFEYGESMTSIWLFTAGLLLDSLAFWLAFGVIPRREKMEIDDKQ